MEMEITHTLRAHMYTLHTFITVTTVLVEVEEWREGTL